MAKIREIYDDTLIHKGIKQVIYPITRAQAVYTSTNIKIQELLDEGYRFGGVATYTNIPSTKQRIFYLAIAPGLYPYYGGLTISGGESAFFLWNGANWQKVGFSSNQNLTGFKTLNSISELPEEETTLGYLINNNLYVWVGEGGDTADGKYQSCGELKGESAYELAVQQGFDGSLDDWLSSLVGAPGASAYEIAVEHGYTGSEEDWVEFFLDMSDRLTSQEIEELLNL